MYSDELINYFMGIAFQGTLIIDRISKLQSGGPCYVKLVEAEKDKHPDFKDKDLIKIHLDSNNNPTITPIYKEAGPPSFQPVPKSKSNLLTGNNNFPSNNYTGPLKVFTDPETGCPFYGSSGGKLGFIGDMLSIQLATANPTTVKSTQHTYKTNMLPINWADGTPGELTETHYRLLLNYIRKEYKEGNISGVVVNCIGGHGRTGTFLCILGLLMGVIDKQSPVKTFRKLYKKESIETKSQEDLITFVASIL